MRSLIIAVLAVGSIPFSSSGAANITVHAEGLLSEFSDPDGLLPFSEPAPDTAFRLSFTYEDTTETQETDDDPNGISSYQGAITALSLRIEGQTYGLLRSNQIFVLNDALVGDEFTDAWLGSTRNTSIDGSVFLIEDIGLNLSSSSIEAPVSTLDSEALVPPFGPNPWDNAFITYRFIRVDRSSGQSDELALARAIVTSVAVVPLPAGFWLLFSALGLLLLRRRTSKLV